MPELNLKFNLPEEDVEARWAQNGGRYHAVIEDLFEELRSNVKYKDRTDWLDLEQLREKLLELLDDHGVHADFL